MSNRPLTKTEWLTSLEELWEAAQQPRKWVGLTDEQLDDVYFCVEGGVNAIETWREQARAIEAKLQERNT